MQLNSSNLHISAFITNLGKYNEGKLIGEWIKLPVTKDEFNQALKRIGIGSLDEFGQPYEEIFISDYDCSLPAIGELLTEYESISRLNYFAACLVELSLYDLEKYTSILESGCDSFKSMDELIDLSFNLDCYDYRADIEDEYDLGYDHVIGCGLYSADELKGLIPYIDFESIGKDIMIDDNGAFAENGYVRRNEDSWIKRFNGDLKDVPEEYKLF